MKETDIVKQHLARKAELEAQLSEVRDQARQAWLSTFPVKDWLNGHNLTEKQSPALARDYAQKKAELERLNAEHDHAKRRASELEKALAEINALQLPTASLLAIRNEEYQAALHDLKQAEAQAAEFNNGIINAKQALRGAEEGVVKAHAVLSAALSMQDIELAQQGVSEAGREKVRIQALISNTEAALRRSAESKAALKLRVRTAEKALMLAKANHARELVTASPEFAAFQAALKEGFAASVEAGVSGEFGRYLAEIFGTQGADGNRIVGDLSAISKAIKEELGVDFAASQI